MSAPIIQISKIQIRRGEKNNLPRDLEEGELCLTRDSGEVFIGQPSFQKVKSRTQKGVFPYSNVKLLTEFDLAQTVGDSFYYHGPLLRTDIPGSGTQDIATSTVCEFMLEDSDAIVVDYSICDKLAYPNVESPSQANLYKRSGTLWIIADRLSANVRDDYVELNTSIPGQSGVSFSATVTGNQSDISSLKISLMANNIERTKTLTMCCRRWRS